MDMHKNVLILLVILFVAPPPCFAQTGYPETHSISNTLWKLFPQESYFGFSGGQVYLCDQSLAACTPNEDSFYNDFLLFTLWYVPIGDGYPGFVFGVIPARGSRGRVIVYNYPLRYTLHDTLLLVSDTWTP